MEALSIEVWLVLPLVGEVFAVCLIFIMLALDQKLLAQDLLLRPLVVPLIDASADCPVDVFLIRRAVYSKCLIGIDLPLSCRLVTLLPGVLVLRALNRIDRVHIQIQIFHTL